jgi:hypothetical protein
MILESILFRLSAHVDLHHAMAAAAEMAGEGGAKCRIFHENVSGLPCLHEPIRDTAEVLVILPPAPDLGDEEFLLDFERYHAGGIVGCGGRLLREVPAHDASRIDSWPVRAARKVAVFDPSGIRCGRLLLPLCGEHMGWIPVSDRRDLIGAKRDGR